MCKCRLKKQVLVTIAAIWLLLAGCGGGSSDSISADNANQDNGPENGSDFQPPEWSIGDTWRVETEVYEDGRFISGANFSEWSRPMPWLFSVEDIKEASKSRYYILSIEPVDENPCPYVFTLWLRIPDFVIYSIELDYLFRGNPSGNVPEAPTIKLNAVDYFKDRFPSFPLWQLPQFEAQTEQDDLSKAMSSQREKA